MAAAMVNHAPTSADGELVEALVAARVRAIPGHHRRELR
jgi:hypothetical protein